MPEHSYFRKVKAKRLYPLAYNRKALCQPFELMPRPERIEQGNVRHPAPYMAIVLASDRLDRRPNLGGWDEDDRGCMSFAYHRASHNWLRMRSPEGAHLLLTSD